MESGGYVVATLCYSRTAAIPGVAAQRTAAAFPGAVVGTLTAGDDVYLVMRDALGDGPTCEAADDRVPLDGLGLTDQDGPWTQPMTGVYRWSGAATNIVVTSVHAPRE